MSVCESVIAIAHSLYTHSDRFALFQTSPDHKNSTSSSKLLSLGKPNLWTLKHALDNVEVCAGVPDAECLGETIELAQSHLESYPRAPSINNHGHETLRQIIVFTSRPHTVASTSCSQEGIGIHVICAGSLPWMSEKPLTGDGWYMDYRPTCRELSSPGKLKDERRIAERFRFLIRMLRASSVPGMLSDLELFVNGGRFCTVEKIIGPTKFETLRAGEVVKTIVKIRMSAPQVDTAENPDLSHGKPKSSKNDKLTDVLDGLLVDNLMPILDAKVRYTHSFLPKGTVCHAESQVRIRVISSVLEPRNDDQRQDLVNFPEDLGPEAALVQKSLMHFFATAHTPASALKLLLKKFGTAADLSICPEYLMLLVAELKYHNRVASRMSSFDKDINDRDNERGAKTISSLKSRPGPRASVRPERWLHEGIDPFPEQDQYAAINLVTDHPRGSVDTTRKVWDDIRKASFSTMLGLRRIRRSSRVVEEQRLDEMAHEAMGKENQAPWL